MNVLPFMMMVFFPGCALARGPGQGHGTVGMHGSIIDTPCSIAADDARQIVEIGVDTTGNVMHDGHGPVREFRIHLLDCMLKPQVSGHPDWSSFRVTFDGPPDNGLFGISGADGIGLLISDREGHVAPPGVPLPASALASGEQVLEYTLQIVGDTHHLRAGDYRSTVRFKVDYF